MNIKRACQLLLLSIIAVTAQAYTYCEYAPYQRADADLHVHFGIAKIPNSDNIIAHVVEYNPSLNKLPMDVTNSRLHTHIWLVDLSTCTKLVALPIPPDAYINVHAVKIDKFALPITKTKNNLIELKYAFAVPAKPKTAIIRQVTLNPNWQIVNQQDYPLTLQKNTRKAIQLADFSANGRLFHLSEPEESQSFLHHIVVFDDNQTVLHEFELNHPEAHFADDAILFDEIRPHSATQYQPQRVLITSFSPTMTNYRQFAGELPSPSSAQADYIYPILKKGQLVLQIGTVRVNARGIRLDNNQPLKNYQGADRLKPEQINSYRWQNNDWHQDNRLRPQLISYQPNP